MTDSTHAMSYAELAHVVHDLKSPLSVVVLETLLLRRKLDDGAHAEMMETITRMLLNIDYIDRMVQDLIDSCAFDAGQLELHRIPTDLRLLVESVAARMTSSRDRGRIVVDAPESVVVRVDALRIERVVANLVSNALKYTPRSARVVIRLEVSPAPRISVTDSGPGVPGDEAQYIFDEHRRGSGAHAHDGNGLGLYVSKRIVEAHGGRIGVFSLPGVGSQFYFELPEKHER